MFIEISMADFLDEACRNFSVFFDGKSTIHLIYQILVMIQNQKCQKSLIVHYSQISDPAKLVGVDKLVKDRNVRVELGETYYHKTQCKNIPKKFVDSFSYYHTECYNQFTRAVSEKTRKPCLIRKRIAFQFEQTWFNLQQ